MLFVSVLSYHVFNVGLGLETADVVDMFPEIIRLSDKIHVERIRKGASSGIDSAIYTVSLFPSFTSFNAFMVP